MSLLSDGATLLALVALLAKHASNGFDSDRLRALAQRAARSGLARKLDISTWP